MGNHSTLNEGHGHRNAQDDRTSLRCVRRMHRCAKLCYITYAVSEQKVTKRTSFHSAVILAAASSTRQWRPSVNCHHCVTVSERTYISLKYVKFRPSRRNPRRQCRRLIGWLLATYRAFIRGLHSKFPFPSRHPSIYAIIYYVRTYVYVRTVAARK
jgi:hypothetical protein